LWEGLLEFAECDGWDSSWPPPWPSSPRPAASSAYSSSIPTRPGPPSISTAKRWALNPPWWQIIPLDLVTDIVIPFTIQDKMAVSYTLETAPVSREEVDNVRGRAAELRAKAGADPAPKQ
jgi:hypothetical protein